MNANELADDLEKYDWYYEHKVTGSDGHTKTIKTCNTEYVWDAATMLRQLQAENEALKKQVAVWERSSKDRAIKLNICAIKVSELEKKLNTRTKELIGASFYEHDYKTMLANNKPVAWMLKTGHGTKILEVKPYCQIDFWTPLYTHPVKKELLDEEIDRIIDSIPYPRTHAMDKHMIKTAFRKAQEK